MNYNEWELDNLERAFNPRPTGSFFTGASSMTIKSRILSQDAVPLRHMLMSSDVSVLEDLL